MPYSIKKYTLVITFNLLFIEIICYAIYQFTPALPEIYYKTWLVTEKNYHPELGWDAYQGKSRPSTTGFENTCSSAFGDSFTHSDEVNDDEAWTSLLSVKFECEVENYGVGGYGLDQTYLKVKNKPLIGRYVFIGVYQEMLRRNHAASWSYYNSRKGTVPKPYFYQQEDGGYVLQSVPENASDEQVMYQHHLNDRYYRIYNIHFPYSYTLLRNLYYKLNIFAGRALILDKPRTRVWIDGEVVELSRFLITSIVNEVQKKGGVPILLFLPSLSDLNKGHNPYNGFYTQIREVLPGTCTLDAFNSLKMATDKGEKLSAPKLHYNVRGNQIIADYVDKALKSDCNIELN